MTVFDDPRRVSEATLREIRGALIEEYFDIIRHVHLNEVDGGLPGAGGSDFGPAFRALAANRYAGWVSLEIFHQPEDPDGTLAATRRFLADMEECIRV